MSICANTNENGYATDLYHAFAAGKGLIWQEDDEDNNFLLTIT